MYETMQDDPTTQLIKARIAQRANISPVQSAIGRGLMVAGGVNPGPDPLTQNLQNEIGMNELRTSNPEFQLQKAQTLANMGVMKDLQTKQLEADQVKEAADRAGATNTPLPASNGPTLPPSGSMPSSIPAFVQGAGQPTTPNTPVVSNPANGPQFTKPDVPEFIQEPPTKEWDSQARAYINKPGKQVVNPEYAANLDVQKSLQSDKAIKQSEQNATIDSSLNLLKSATAKYKNLVNSNQGQGRISGAIGQVKGTLGFNAANTTWESFKKSAAPIFAAAASPRTPTLLVQYYMDTLGSAPQTNAEFEGRIGNLIDEQMARRSGYSGEFDTNKLNALKQEILNTPAENPVKMGGQSGENIPTFNTLQEAETKGYKGKAIIGGVKGTVS